MILSFCNVKGGVGKTTSAVNLAAAFAHSDLEVLLIDLDPQGSASRSLGMPMDELKPSAASVLVEGKTIRKVVVDTGIPRLDLVTGATDLAAVELKLVGQEKPHKLLAKALAPERRRYDLVLIDCPPGLSLLTLNALAASDAYVLPVVPHDLAVEALERFFAGLEEVAPVLRRMPELLGVLLTMVDHRTPVTAELVEKVRATHGDKVFETEIPINIRLAVAPRHGMTIFEFERWSPGARAYSRLGAELIGRVRSFSLKR